MKIGVLTAVSVVFQEDQKQRRTPHNPVLFHSVPFLLSFRNLELRPSCANPASDVLPASLIDQYSSAPYGVRGMLFKYHPILPVIGTNIFH